MYAGCYLSLPRHCISPSVWHIWQTFSPINAMVSPRLLSLHLQYAEFRERRMLGARCAVKSLECAAVGYFSCLLVWMGFMNIIPAERVVKRSPGSSGSKAIMMDVKCWKDIVGQSVGPHHRSLMWSRWHNSLLLSLSLSSSGRVYQRCPEYLTGKRAHPWDLICTGVHLVEVVWDNLHIMSHLHPSFMKMAHLL